MQTTWDTTPLTVQERGVRDVGPFRCEYCGESSGDGYSWQVRLYSADFRAGKEPTAAGAQSAALAVARNMLELAVMAAGGRVLWDGDKEHD